MPPPIVQVIRAEITDFTSKMAVVRGELATTAASTAAWTAAGVAGAAAIVDLAIKGVDAYKKLGDQTRVLQNVTGATAQQASTMIGVFDAIGVSADKSTVAFARFGKNIEDMPQKFEALGVPIAKNADGTNNLIGTYQNLIKTYQGSTDAAQRDAIMMDLLGRGASGLSTALNLSAADTATLTQHLKDMGLVMSQDGVEATRRYGIATQELHQDWVALEMHLGEKAVPVLTDLALNLNRAAQAHTLWGGIVAGADLMLGHHNSTVKQTDDAVQKLTTTSQRYGVALSDVDAATIVADKSQTQFEAAVNSFRTKMIDTAQSVGMSVEGMKSEIGVFGEVAPEDFYKVERSAQQMAAAISAGEKAAESSFAKATDAVSYFSATSISSREKAADTAEKAGARTTAADTRVADAEQRVADLTEQFADEAAKAKEQYAAKVEANNQQVADAESRYADTVESTDQRIRDADQRLADDRISLAQSVADAQSRLADDQAAGHESVAAAEQRLADIQRRQQVQGNPAALKALDEQIQLRDATAAVSKAKEAAAKKEEADQDAIAKAKDTQTKTLAKDQENADKARRESAKQVEAAEDAIAKAKAEQNKLALEGLTVGQETKKQAEEMRRAIEDISKAQTAANNAIITGTTSASDAIQLTTQDVANFYKDSIGASEKFSDEIHTAIEKGYNPLFIARLMEEGPKEAQPVLDLIANQTDNTFRDMVNNGETKLAEMRLHTMDLNNAVEIAARDSSGRVRADFDLEMKALAVLGTEGGHDTAENLARELGVGRDDIERIAGEYGGALASGINPVLEGIGAPDITLTDHAAAAARFAGEHFAGGGTVPGVGFGDTVPAWLTPGEFVWSKPAVDQVGAQNLDKAHKDAIRGYAGGGFVSSADVPKPPDYSAYGNVLGYSADQVDRFAYAKVVDYLAGRANQAGLATYYGGQYDGDATSWINQALAIDGKPQSWFQGVYNRMMQESGGRNIPQETHDINTDLGTPAFGPMQIIEPTFNAYAAPGHHDWHNPVDSTAAAINYIASRYGDPYNLPAGGYAAGGLVKATSFDTGGWLQPGFTLAHNGTGAPERVGGSTVTITGPITVVVQGATGAEAARDFQTELLRYQRANGTTGLRT